LPSLLVSTQLPAHIVCGAGQPPPVPLELLEALAPPVLALVPPLPDEALLVVDPPDPVAAAVLAARLPPQPRVNETAMKQSARRRVSKEVMVSRLSLGRRGGRRRPLMKRAPRNVTADRRTA
jgi:hypothetical protein